MGKCCSCFLHPMGSPAVSAAAAPVHGVPQMPEVSTASAREHQPEDHEPPPPPHNMQQSGSVLGSLKRMLRRQGSTTSGPDISMEQIDAMERRHRKKSYASGVYSEKSTSGSQRPATPPVDSSSGVAAAAAAASQQSATGTDEVETASTSISAIRTASEDDTGLVKLKEHFISMISINSSSDNA